jgi:uncharacterized protein
MPRLPSRRSAVLALLLLVPAPSIGTIMAMWILPGPIGQTIYGICKVWLLGLPLFWTVAIDRSKLGWSPPTEGGLGMGAALGIAIGGLILSGYAIAGKRLIDAAHVQHAAQQNGIGSQGIFLAFAGYLALINSLLEEYVWRWFVFRKCEVLLPGMPAVLLAAVLFTIHHFVALQLQLAWNMVLLASLGVFTGGVLWSWMYLRYRSIWPSYICHVIVDVAILTIGWWVIFGT